MGLLPVTLVLSIWFQRVNLVDLEFTQAVEEFVMRAEPSEPPKIVTALIEDLNTDKSADRDMASKRLYRYMKENYNQHLWLFWGRRSRYPEVRLRCNTILRNLYPCTSCGGSGMSRTYREENCLDCQGIKSIWMWSFAD